MFEARLTQGKILKQILEALKVSFAAVAGPSPAALVVWQALHLGCRGLHVIILF